MFCMISIYFGKFLDYGALPINGVLSTLVNEIMCVVVRLAFLYRLRQRLILPVVVIVYPYRP